MKLAYLVNNKLSTVLYYRKATIYVFQSGSYISI